MIKPSVLPPPFLCLALIACLLTGSASASLHLDPHLDPQLTQKRLGDGFYEQKLISDQIVAQTGRRYLGQYSDTDAQFKALMDSGVAAARQFDLAPGVALSGAQIAALTADIVWLVQQQVTLPDGSQQSVLTPVVYLSQAHANVLKPNGALIAADDINLQVAGALQNSGALKGGSRMLLAANDILNRGGSISSGGDSSLLAANDILNQSGSIGGARVALFAGRKRGSVSGSQF